MTEQLMDEWMVGSLADLRVGRMDAGLGIWMVGKTVVELAEQMVAE